MGTVASQITSLTIVYSTVYSDADQRKHLKLHVTGLCAGNSPGTGEFPAQMASNAENVSVSWRHHEKHVRCGSVIVSAWFLSLASVAWYNNIQLREDHILKYHTKTQFPHIRTFQCINSLTFQRRVLWWSRLQNLGGLLNIIIYL